MSCILDILGDNFDVDAFIKQSKIEPYKIFYKGSPRFKTKPDGKKNEYSGCAIEVSKAGFDDFKQQEKDAVFYLQTNYHSLLQILTFPDIQFATLNFGVDFDENKFVQSHYLPNELLKLVVDLGIGIELSVYQPGE